MITGHGTVTARQAIPHHAYRRYVAMLDVMGMQKWLDKVGPQEIAERLDVALVAHDQSSMGHANGRQYGPLISTTHFSDTVLAWSLDDSWTSLVAMCGTVKMIVAVALGNGVPLRGAISVGEVVCNRQTLKFVGQPIVDAYLWSERNRPYRSAGVDLTPRTIDAIQSKFASDPMPDYWDSDTFGISKPLLTKARRCSRTLVWYEGGLFVNHWAHGIFLNHAARNESNPVYLFTARGLDLSPDAQTHLNEMMKFFRATWELMYPTFCPEREIADRAAAGTLTPSFAKEYAADCPRRMQDARGRLDPPDYVRRQTEAFFALDQVRLAKDAF